MLLSLMNFQCEWGTSRKYAILHLTINTYPLVVSQSSCMATFINFYHTNTYDQGMLSIEDGKEIASAQNMANCTVSGDLLQRSPLFAHSDKISMTVLFITSLIMIIQF